MKILKYIAVLAASLLAGAVYAADNPNANGPISVQVTTEDGAIVLTITVNPEDGLSTEDAIKKAIQAALSKVAPNSLNGKAIASAVAAVKAVIEGKSEQMSTQLKVMVNCSNNTNLNENIAVVKTVVEVNGAKYESNTETTYNPETEVAQTTGNVTTTSAAGVTTQSSAISVSVNSNGDLVGSVGNAGVTDNVSAAAATTATGSSITTPTSEQAAQEGSTDVVPDNTIVTSESN